MRNLEHTLPLHLAALEGQIEVIKTLVRFGADINCVDKYVHSLIQFFYLFLPIQKTIEPID